LNFDVMICLWWKWVIGVSYPSTTLNCVCLRRSICWLLSNKYCNTKKGRKKEREKNLPTYPDFLGGWNL